MDGASICLCLTILTLSLIPLLVTEARLSCKRSRRGEEQRTLHEAAPKATSSYNLEGMIMGAKCEGECQRSLTHIAGQPADPPSQHGGQESSTPSTRSQRGTTAPSRRLQDRKDAPHRGCCWRASTQPRQSADRSPRRSK